jgi:hypothetical protein
LSVSAVIAYDYANDTASFTSSAIDPGFVLTPTGSIIDGTVTGLEITTTNATTTGANLSIQEGPDNTVYSSAGETYAFITTPTASNDAELYVVQPTGYSYTQLGDWYQCSANCLSGVSTEVGGFFVRGEVTSPANIPTTGSYTYNGNAYGAGIDAAGNAGSGTATMTATADFVTRSIAFATSSTIVQPFAGGAPLAMPELDISGTLSYTAGQNRFTGPVNSGTGVTAMSGTATGQFHGAAAQEIGGVYSLTGAGGAHLGVFVGK